MNQDIRQAKMKKKIKYFIYAYILWLLLHIIFLINGDNRRGFFPFYDGFDIEYYGFIEFFVYVVVLPIVAYILYDIIPWTKISSKLKSLSTRITDIDIEFDKKIIIWSLRIIGSLIAVLLAYHLISVLFLGANYNYSEVREKIRKDIDFAIYFTIVFLITGLINFLLVKFLHKKIVISRTKRPTKIIGNVIFYIVDIVIIIITSQILLFFAGGDYNVGFYFFLIIALLNNIGAILDNYEND